MKALLPATVRPMLEGRLPTEIEPLWWSDGAELVALAPQADIGWFDMFDKSAPLAAISRAGRLRWLNTLFAGVDWMPLGDLAARGVRLTNGSGITTNAVAEFTLAAMLSFANRMADLLRAADRQEWHDPRTVGERRELAGARVLIVGYGEIGQAIGRMLAGFGAHVVPVRRTARDGALGADDWAASLPEFDWVVLTTPATPETRGLLNAARIAAMRPGAVLVNMGRADVVDQAALIEALHSGHLGGAILDLTDPEPLPPGHPLWSAPNACITMHTAGLPNRAARQAAADRFLANCALFLSGQPLEWQVDLARGY